MRAAVLHAYGPPENLLIEEVAPPPLARADHVRVAIHASSINPVDYKIRAGKQRGVIRYRLPRSIGLDLSGVITEVGSAVKAFAVGDEVVGSPHHRHPGAYAEETVVPAAELARKPARLTHVEAASLPLVGLTAWQCLYDKLAERRGQRAFIMAGSGGVGTIAIQIAKHLGAHVATTCSPRNHALVQELGADQVIDYRTTRFEDVLSDLDLVLDSLGGDATDRALKLLVRGGRLASINSGLPANTERFGPELGAMATGLHIAGLRLKGFRRGVDATTVVRKPDGALLQKLMDLVEEGVIQPVIDRTYPLDDIAAAHAYGQTGRARGKVVIQVR